MEMIVEALSWFFLMVGAFFVLAGAIGVIRLGDFYQRAHAAGMTDTMGAFCVLIGLMIQGGLSLVTIKLLLIAALIFFTSPVGSHALARAAMGSGLKPKLADDIDHADASKEEDAQWKH